MQRRGTRRVLLGVMLTISLAAMGAWVQTAPAKVKLERLKIAVAPLGWDTNFTWLQSRSGQLDKRPALEYLVGIDRNTGALTAGPTVSGVFLGGASGGVGDPFQFAVSGTSPVWENNCTLIAEGGPYAYLNACQVLTMSGGPGSNSGSHGGGNGVPQQPPPTSFVLQVLVDGAYGGSVVSSPPGIDYNPAGLNENFFEHAFPTGSSVTLTATPPDTAQSYDVKWTGACSGDTTSSGAFMNQDQHCYVSFTPVSSR